MGKLSHEEACIFWVNALLKDKYTRITSYEEFTDGVALIKVLETLTETTITYNMEPNDIWQRLVNAQIIVDLCKRGLCMKGSIDPQDIIYASPNHITAMIWLLYRLFPLAVDDDTLALMATVFGTRKLKAVPKKVWTHEEAPDATGISMAESRLNELASTAMVEEDYILPAELPTNNSNDDSISLFLEIQMEDATEDDLFSDASLLSAPSLTPRKGRAPPSRAAPIHPSPLQYDMEGIQRLRESLCKKTIVIPPPPDLPAPVRKAKQPSRAAPTLSTNKEVDVVISSHLSFTPNNANSSLAFISPTSLLDVITLQSLIRGFLARRRVARIQRNLVDMDMTRAMWEGNEEAEQAAICIQSHFRGFLCRKDLERQRKRRTILSGFVSQCRELLEVVGLLWDVYYNDLLLLPSDVQSMKIRLFISKTLTLCKLFDAMVYKVETRLSSWQDVEVVVSDVFKALVVNVNAILSFAHSYSEMLVAIEEDMSNPTIAGYMFDCAEKAKKDLSQLLLVPFQIFSLCFLTLQRVVRVTSPLSPDGKYLSAVQSQLEDVAAIVSLKEKMALCLSSVFSVVALVDGLGAVMKEGRRLWRQSALMDITCEDGVYTSRKRHFFLFNDCLVCTEPKDLSLWLESLEQQGYAFESLVRYDLAYMIPMELCNVALLEEEEALRTCGYRYAIRVNHPERPTHIYTSQNEETISAWMWSLDEAIALAMEKGRLSRGIRLGNRHDVILPAPHLQHYTPTPVAAADLQDVEVESMVKFCIVPVGDAAQAKIKWTPGWSVVTTGAFHMYGMGSAAEKKSDATPSNRMVHLIAFSPLRANFRSFSIAAVPHTIQVLVDHQMILLSFPRGSIRSAFLWHMRICAWQQLVDVDLQLAQSYQLAMQNESILSLLSLEGNDACVDCSLPYPVWCSTLLGILLCGTCAAVHASELGEKFIPVNLIAGDIPDAKLRLVVALGGNKAVNERQSEEVSFAHQPSPAASLDLRREWILSKYGNLISARTCKHSPSRRYSRLKALTVMNGDIIEHKNVDTVMLSTPTQVQPQTPRTVIHSGYLMVQRKPDAPFKRSFVSLSKEAMRFYKSMEVSTAGFVISTKELSCRIQAASDELGPRLKVSSGQRAKPVILCSEGGIADLEVWLRHLTELSISLLRSQ